MSNSKSLLTFIFTEAFERSTAGWLDEDSLHRLQSFLCENPEAGDVIPKTCGVRKVRIGLPGRGKRGAGRVIYLYRSNRGLIYLMLGYKKNVQENITDIQRKALCALVKMLEEE